MRTLPDSPSLKHLRQQAKVLLQQMRATQPTATLSDAQTAVAEQYRYTARAAPTLLRRATLGVLIAPAGRPADGRHSVTCVTAARAQPRGRAAGSVHSHAKEEASAAARSF